MFAVEKTPAQITNCWGEHVQDEHKSVIIRTASPSKVYVTPMKDMAYGKNFCHHHHCLVEHSSTTADKFSLLSSV